MARHAMSASTGTHGLVTSFPLDTMGDCIISTSLLVHSIIVAPAKFRRNRNKLHTNSNLKRKAGNRIAGPASLRRHASSHLDCE